MALTLFFFRKLVVFALLALVASLHATSPPIPCGCWDGWERENDAQGWRCKEKNSEQRIACDMDKPPACICKEKGNPVNVPFPATNCVGGDNPNRFDKNECESNAEWEAWFNKYPNFRLHY